ncbi:sugar transferase [Thermaerobacter sp. PB12/4term]|uniref:sugar transferase n=1 Tax=Thermaerobacter sp. PB12/4term TaxID=2293838 RepID=UPI0013141601|nr:sugar transferase [Thermaerobacter sp. PB12/4term]QIA26696.1 sugar transferase [Thermaerobacter sp. PB12/4term]
MAGDEEGLQALLDRGPLSSDGFAAAIAAVSTIVLLALYRGYRDLHRPFMELVRDIVTAALWSVLLTMAALYLYIPSRGVSRAAAVIAGVLGAVLLCLWRIPFARSARQAFYQHQVALVSSDPKGWRARLTGYISIRHALTPGVFLEAPPATDRVILAPDVPIEYRERIVAWALRNQVDLFVVPNTYEILLASGRLTQVRDIPLMTVYRLALPIELRAVKRALDLAGALLLALMFFPVLLIVPLLIWLEDRGPVFYRQRRVGRDGRIFELIKFRTMVPDAEKYTGPVWASVNDPRVTRIGKWLRATRLDELPQLFNVLRGDMSLVGPRPERPEMVTEFAARNPLFRAREALKPGITGLAQVFGPYDLDPDSKLTYDLLYIARWGIMLDLMVLLWTIPVMLFPQALGRSLGRTAAYFAKRWGVHPKYNLDR